MVKTAKNRKLKKIIAGVAATTMVIAAGSALAVSAANHYEFNPEQSFSRGAGINATNYYVPGPDAAYAYNVFTIDANLAGKSYTRMSSAGGMDTKATDNYAATNYARSVQSTKVYSSTKRPYSMNMSITRGNQQVDNYYTAV